MAVLKMLTRLSCCPQGLARLTIAEDEELLSLPYSDLSRQGKEVVWDTLRILAHDPARVRACRVEVSQKSAIPLICSLSLLLRIVALRVDVVRDKRLDCVLCVSVRIGWAQRAVFRNGDHSLEAGRIAIHCGRR